MSISSALQDLRYAVRTLAKNPTFTLVAVVSIGLGVGANSTIFTWLKSVAIDPLPGVPASQELLTMNAAFGPRTGYSSRYADYVYLRDHNSVYSGLLAHEMLVVNVSSNAKPEVLMGGIVSANYFTALEVKPFLGRGFLSEEATGPEAHPVAVLSQSLWKRRFGENRDVIGKPMTINGHPFTIVGVAPEGFGGVYGGLGQQLWVPVMMSRSVGAGDDPQKANVQIMGRRKPGVSQQQAQADMHVLARQLAAEFPTGHKNFDELVYPLSKAERGIQSSLIQFIEVLMAVAGLVLLIACANVANLLLARSTLRSREMGIRLAMGASRVRIVRQLLTESFLLAMLGGFAGIMLTFWTGGSLIALLPSFGGITANLNLSVDRFVVGFSLAVVLLTGFVFGMVPALQASRSDLAESLKQGSRGSTGARGWSILRRALVVSQIALSMIALIGAGLFARSLRASLAAPLGFETRNVLLTTFNAFLNGYDHGKGQQFFTRLLEDVQSRPGIESASLVSFVPLRGDGGGNSVRVSIEGYTPGANEEPAIVTDYAGPQYLRTMRIPLAEGRDFSWQDRESAPGVVVVNEALVRRYWPDGHGLGRHIKVGDSWREVVGVTRNFTYRNLNEPLTPIMYLPLLQNYQAQMTLLVRTTGDPAAALGTVESSVRTLDPNMPLARIETLEHSISESLAPQRIALILLSSFSGIALVLTAVGIYGVISYLVSQRSREIGIRMALGAEAKSVLAMVMSQGLRLGVIGVMLGLLGSLALTRVLSSLLFGVSAQDPGTFLAVAVVLLLAAGIACYLPARRASRLDPIRVLRED